MLSDVNVSVNVGFSPEKDQRGRPFNLPDVPNTVFAEVVVPIESDVEVIELRRSEELERFVGVFLAKRRQNVGENFANVPLLVARKIGDGNAGEFLGLAGQSNGFSSFFPSGSAKQGEPSLFAVEHLENFVGAFCLIPVSVSGMGRRFGEVFAGLVSVKDGAAECGAF